MEDINEEILGLETSKAIQSNDMPTKIIIISKIFLIFSSKLE